MYKTWFHFITCNLCKFPDIVNYDKKLSMHPSVQVVLVFLATPDVF